jgi:hypothetical protein
MERGCVSALKGKARLRSGAKAAKVKSLCEMASVYEKHPAALDGVKFGRKRRQRDHESPRDGSCHDSARRGVNQPTHRMFIRRFTRAALVRQPPSDLFVFSVFDFDGAG